MHAPDDDGLRAGNLVRGGVVVELFAQPLNMPLANPFRISRSVQYEAHNLLVRLQDGEFVGIGECAPRSYYGETQATALAALDQYADHLGIDPYAIEHIMARLERVLHRNASVRAGIDMALYDLVGKKLSVPVYRLLGLSPAHLPVTSYTIPIDTPAEMARKAMLARDYPILKIKLGTKHDVEIVREIRDVSSAILRVDANAAWTVKDALRMIDLLAPYDLEMIEQPIPPGDLAGLKLLRDHSPIPIFADESCVTCEDIPPLAGVVDGINIKLVKCGGISHALKMIHVARAHGLRVMIGCMIESSLGITAAAHLAPLVDYLDLDGALLLADDPFSGVGIVEGRLMLPDAPGLGVRPRDLRRFLDEGEQQALLGAGTTTHHATPNEEAAHHRPANGHHPTRADAWALMTTHVKQESLRRHMLAVEAAMRAYARKFGEAEEQWGITGLLHDCDYEEYPDLHEHTQISAQWLREDGYDEAIVHAILAHNDINGIPRDDRLSKALVACDEITGLISAAALMRPDKSIIGLEAPSVRKKMKDKSFARAIKREDIINGAADLGVDLDEHIAFVIDAMRAIAPQLGLAGTEAGATARE
jgi:putative nucleotidyltransferase with HDIG domain